MTLALATALALAVAATRRGEAGEAVESPSSGGPTYPGQHRRAQKQNPVYEPEATEVNRRGTTHRPPPVGQDPAQEVEHQENRVPRPLYCEGRVVVGVRPLFGLLYALLVTYRDPAEEGDKRPHQRVPIRAEHGVPSNSRAHEQYGDALYHPVVECPRERLPGGVG